MAVQASAVRSGRLRQDALGGRDAAERAQIEQDKEVRCKAERTQVERDKEGRCKAARGQVEREPASGVRGAQHVGLLLVQSESESSGYEGVQRIEGATRRQWRATILQKERNRKRKVKVLGCFSTARDAAICIALARKEMAAGLPLKTHLYV